MSTAATPIRLGLRENWRQFALLVLINAFVGGMVGLERTVLPLIAEQEFALASRTAILSFIISFGVVKALANMAAGQLGDQWGRRKVLIAGWLVGLPVPFIVMWAPTWEWIIFANVLLGINQGLAWSTTVIMKIDLVGPRQRGLAMGLNEAGGYLAVSLAALGSGYIAASYALRPHPFYLGIFFAVTALLLTVVFVKETLPYARHEASLQDNEPRPDAGTTASDLDDPARSAATSPNESSPARSFTDIFAETSWRNRTLFSVSQAGMINNLNDGMAWGLFPLYFAAAGLDVARIGWLAALYPAVWGLGQLATGALSDRLGRKGLIVSGMFVQSAGIFLVASGEGFTTWVASMLLMGAGTAMVYPTLLAAVSDVAHPSWRGASVGVYRLWRDGGYAVGALLAGILADLFSFSFAIAVIGCLTLVSGAISALVMKETLPASRPAAAPSG